MDVRPLCVNEIEIRVLRGIESVERLRGPRFSLGTTVPGLTAKIVPSFKEVIKNQDTFKAIDELRKKLGMRKELLQIA